MKSTQMVEIKVVGRLLTNHHEAVQGKPGLLVHFRLTGYTAVNLAPSRACAAQLPRDVCIRLQRSLIYTSQRLELDGSALSATLTDNAISCVAELEGEVVQRASILTEIKSLY